MYLFCRADYGTEIVDIEAAAIKAEGEAYTSRQEKKKLEAKLDESRTEDVRAAKEAARNEVNLSSNGPTTPV